MDYIISLKVTVEPIMPSELPKIRIDYKELLHYAEQKGVRVIDLTEMEKMRFVTPEE